MSNTAEIVAVVNTLLTLVRESNLAIEPLLDKIRIARAADRELTDEDLLAAAAVTDAARAEAEAAVSVAVQENLF